MKDVERDREIECEGMKECVCERNKDKETEKY